MKTIFRFDKRLISWERVALWLVALSLLTGFIFSVISSLGLCDSECNETKYYRFYGLPFAFFGLGFFGTSFLFVWFGQTVRRFQDIAGWMIASAFGAELWFLVIQKYMIKQWCPICVSIAISVGIAGFAYICYLVMEAKKYKKQEGNRRDQMKILGKGGVFFAFVIIGFFIAFTGISKPNYALRSQDAMEQKTQFGNIKSPIVVYFVSDWFCSACKKIEPEVEKMAPLIMGKAKLYFIDYTIHPESQNYSAYNLAFMVNDKNQYLKARHLLAKMTEKTKNPNETDIKKEAEKQNIPFKELSFSDVRSGVLFFEKTAESLDIEGTPTMVIMNTKTGNKKELRGASEITQQNVIETINELMKEGKKAKN